MLRHFGLLLGGRTGGAILGLAATALTARGLPAAEFGLVVLVHAYALLFQGLFNPHSFEAVVRFGVAGARRADRRRLVAAFLRLDLAGALAGAAVAATLAPAAGALLALPAEAVVWAAAYSSVIALSPSAAMTGVLRLYDRFDRLAQQSLIRQLLRLAGVAIAFGLGAGPAGYLIAWYASLAAEQLWLLAWGWRETRRRLGRLRLGGAGARPLAVAYPGVWRYAAAAYGQSLIDLANKQVLTLLVGGLLGPAGAGQYRLAREVAKVFAWPVALVREAMLPELARLWPENRHRMLQLTARACAIAALAGAAIWTLVHLGAERVLATLAGPAYLDAAPLTSLLVAAALLELTGAPMRPAIFASGRPGAVLRVSTLALALHFALLLALTPGLGLLGPGFAALAGAGLSLGGLAGFVWLRLRRAGPGAPPATARPPARRP